MEGRQAGRNKGRNNKQSDKSSSKKTYDRQRCSVAAFPFLEKGAERFSQRRRIIRGIKISLDLGDPASQMQGLGTKAASSRVMWV